MRVRGMHGLFMFAKESMALATCRNVLHGISREWWDIAKEHVTSWNDFKVKFIAAFVSDDYEDEMIDRVKECMRGENESIIAFSVRALCKRSESGIQESEAVKLMLKNMSPYLVSHLRGRTNTVDDV